MRWLVIVLVSGALGVGAAMSDVLSAGPHPAGWWRAAAMVLNAGSIWAGLAVLCGWLALRPLAGAVAAVFGLAIAVLGYYGYAVLLGIRAAHGLSSVSGRIEFWLVASVLLGPVLGLVGALARRPDLLGLVAAWVLPLGIAAEMIAIRRYDEATFAVDPWLATAAAGLVAFGALLALAALIRWLAVRTPRQRAMPAASTTSVERSYAMESPPSTSQ